MGLHSCWLPWHLKKSFNRSNKTKGVNKMVKKCQKKAFLKTLSKNWRLDLKVCAHLSWLLVFKNGIKKCSSLKNYWVREAFKSKKVHNFGFWPNRGGGGSGPDPSKPNPYFEMSKWWTTGGSGRYYVFECTVTTKVGADLFNFGLTVYSTNTKAGLAPQALWGLATSTDQYQSGQYIEITWHCNPCDIVIRTPNPSWSPPPPLLPCVMFFTLTSNINNLVIY